MNPFTNTPYRRASLGLSGAYDTFLSTPRTCNHAVDRYFWRQLEGDMLYLWFCTAMALVFRGRPTRERLRHLLIELPARKLGQLTPPRLAFLLLVVAAAAAVIAFAKSDGMALVAQAVPEGLGWFAAFDVATYIDVIALIWLVAATVRLRAALHALRSATDRARRWMLSVTGLFHDRSKSGARSRSRRDRRKIARPPKGEGEGWPASTGWAFT